MHEDDYLICGPTLTLELQAFSCYSVAMGDSWHYGLNQSQWSDDTRQDLMAQEFRRDLNAGAVRLTPATRSIAPPMPLTSLPGIIQLARWGPG